VLMWKVARSAVAKPNPHFVPTVNVDDDELAQGGGGRTCVAVVPKVIDVSE